LALDVIYNDLSSDDRKKVEKWLIEGPVAFYKAGRTNWRTTEIAARGIWALYYRDRAEINEMKEEFKVELAKYVDSDGVFIEGPAYALARFASPDASHLNLFPDVLSFTKEWGSGDWYNNKSYETLHEYIFGYGFTPTGLIWNIGDSYANRTYDTFRFGAQRAGKFTELAGRYERKSAAEGDLTRGKFATYTLMRDPIRPVPLNAGSRIFRYNSANFTENTNSPNDIASVLVNPTEARAHNHKEVNSIHMSAYGFMAMTGTGYNEFRGSWRVGEEGTREYSWEAINLRAVTNSTALIDYSITANGGTNVRPSQTNDHAATGALGFEEDGKKGAGVKGLITGIVDTATGDSGTAIPNGKHLRHMFQVMPNDGAKGYTIAYDEIMPYASYKPGQNFFVNTSWHPAGPSVTTVVDRQEYRWYLGAADGKNVFMTVFLGTGPINTNIYKGPYAPVREADYIFNQYPIDPISRKADLVTVLYPHYRTSDFDSKATFTRIRGNGYNGAAIRSTPTVVDYALTAKSAVASPLPGYSIRGSAIFTRFVNEQLSTYSGRAASRILMVDPNDNRIGFESSAPINITMRGANGKVDVPGAASVNVTFRKSAFNRIKLNGNSVTSVAAGTGFVTVSMAPGSYIVELLPAAL
jgi:hypothetical protein